jgi:pimeloyl-ACP methyl ester carboxylesterase
VTDDPFTHRYEVPVAGGSLHVARAGPPAEEAASVVLCAHGVASSHLIWRTVARELSAGSRPCLLAPDLRGRGRSAELGGPYGMAAHAADLLAVLDDAGARQAVVVGHSLGGYAAAALAALHPDRVSALVLLDGGLAISGYPEEMADELVEAMVDSALEFARLPFESVEAHVDQWRAHPAFRDDWNCDVEAYAVYDVADGPGPLHATVSAAAVRADIGELVRDEVTREAVDRVRAPLSFVRARRGLRGGLPLVPQMILTTFATTHPHARVEDVADANHYTLVLGAGSGPVRVAAAIEAAISPPAPHADR